MTYIAVCSIILGFWFVVSWSGALLIAMCWNYQLPVQRIKIGVGPTVFKKYFSRFPVEVGLVPLSTSADIDFAARGKKSLQEVGATSWKLILKALFEVALPLLVAYLILGGSRTSDNIASAWPRAVTGVLQLGSSTQDKLQAFAASSFSEQFALVICNIGTLLIGLSVLDILGYQLLKSVGEKGVSIVHPRSWPWMTILLLNIFLIGGWLIAIVISFFK